MNLHPVSIILLLLCFPNAFSATGDVSINCGTRGTSEASSGREWHGDGSSGREWHGDGQPKIFPSLQIKGSSTTSTVVHNLISGDDPIPYKTSRLSRLPFSYTIMVNPGQKILRLHFNPAPYKDFKRFMDLFDVEAGPFTLLSNFSASLTADALGVNSFVKEYCINIDENQELNVVFSPASSQKRDTYAFINGIEIISTPAGSSYFHGGDIGVQEVGKSLVYIDNNTALEIIRRINVKSEFVASDNGIFDMFGMGGTVLKRQASKTNNITWKVSVDVGFRYLVRLHFSQLGLNFSFKICINERIGYTDVHIIKGRDDENNIPSYKDFVVMMKGSKQLGKWDFLIHLQPNDELMYGHENGHGPLQGFEIIKLSNPDNSLSSPNPLPSAPSSSYWMLQTILQVLGYRNMAATAVITVLALVNTIIYSLGQNWDGSGTKEENIPSVCRHFSLSEIQLATGDFSDANLIGSGGFGKVYKGIIDRETVAIKRLRADSKQGACEFLTEIETLTELHHVNLVSLIGCCNEHHEMILVYEYMARGTLDDHIFKISRKRDEECPSLTWKQCLNICIGAARGLDYLHTVRSLIHRDIKASNILLDENFMAKISDFGLAKHLNRRKLESHVSTKVKGTFGYFDPDYFRTGYLTKKSDTYAFGVVLLEVLSGRPAFDPSVPEDEQILIVWARESIREGKTERIVASNLRGEVSEDSLEAFVGVAEKCLNEDPKKRPTMAEVVVQLEFALGKQESSKSSLRKGIRSDVVDVGQCDEETNLSVSTGKLTVASSTNVQNLESPPKEQTNSKMANAESPSGDGRKTTTRKPSRVRQWDALWNRVKPSSKNELLLSGNPVAPAIPLDELKEITDNFSCEYTEDLDGFIYHGVLKSGKAAAIKKLDSRLKSEQEFLAQVSKVFVLKHKNLVEVLGYCVHGGLRVLAYEYVPKSLRDVLHGREGVKGAKPEPGPVLSWAQRVKIALGAAQGLEYLHDQKQQIHGDIKSRNILLSDDCNVAKIKMADFDLSKNDPDMYLPYSTSTIWTPVGYESPEYKLTGQLSCRSDVYSFGVVLLELVTGLKPLDYRRFSRTLVDWARTCTLMECVDPRMNGDYPKKAVVKMTAVATSCVQVNAESRPSMSFVVKDLQSLLSSPI